MAILQQRYVDQFRVLLLEKFRSQMSFLGCFKTAVKLNLFDDALNLALDRLNLTFSIENLQASAVFAKVEVDICLRV